MLTPRNAVAERSSSAGEVRRVSVTCWMVVTQVVSKEQRKEV